ncbi:hypothetical protein ACN47E_000795 [Coniothyrium glycines]
MSGASLYIVYPRKEGATFDKEYYIKTHLPLAQKVWEKHGMKSYAITEFAPDSPYSIGVVAEFESLEGWGAAAKDSDTKQVIDDVKNFSSEGPILFAGNIIGRN